MRFIPVLLPLLCLAACSGATQGVEGSRDIGSATPHQQVQLDVQAMIQGMSHARAQDEAIARARAP